MSTRKKRGRSLDQSNKNQKGNWLRYIFGGFGTSQGFRKRDKSEKSAYSQTEIFHSRSHNETGTQYSDYNLKSDSKYSESTETLTNVVSIPDIKECEKSRKLYHKNLDMSRSLLHDVMINRPDIEEALSRLFEDLFNESYYENIKNEAKNVQSFMILQRMKFKHELSKLYHKIYTKNEVDPNSYSFYQEIFAGYESSNDNLHKNLKTKWKRKHFKSVVASNEQEIKELCCTTRRNTTKRYTIKKSQIAKNGNLQVDDVEGHKTDSEVANENDVERKISEDSHTGHCAVSVSPLSTPPSLSNHLFVRHGNDEIRQMNSRKSTKHGNGDTKVCAIDSAEGLQTGNIYRSVEDNTFIFHNNEGTVEDQRTLKGKFEKTRLNQDSNKSYVKDSSIILDIEVQSEVKKGNRKSSNSQHSFSDLKTLSSQDDSSVQDLVSAGLAVAQSTISSCTEECNSNTQNNQNLNLSRSLTESEDTVCDSNHSCEYIEKICESDKIESTKFPQVGNNCVTLSDALSYPFGTLCEVLSEDLSNDTNVSFSPRNHSRLTESKKTTPMPKSGPTFWRHTISSRLKMKHE